MYRTSIFSEQKEIISSGTVISFNNEPITLKLFEDTTNVVTLKFVFKNNPEEKKEALSGVNRSLSSRQMKKQKILLKMVSVICRGHLFMQHPASYGNSLVRGNLDDADAVGSCSNE